MKHLRKAASQELVSFLEGYKLEEVLRDPQLNQRLSQSFKKYYPLLLLEGGIDRKPPWSNNQKTEVFRLYFRESISDICQSLLLTVQGFYKPAQLSLRSGLENWVRCIGLAQDQGVLSLTSVFELMDLVKATPIVTSSKMSKQYFDTIRSRYSILCGYVHTTNASHMALTTAAGSFPRYISRDACLTFDAIDEVCSRVTWTFCLVAGDTYRGMHHSHFDIVSDSLPPKLKAALHAR